jgi:hypothetical protein
MSKYVDEIIKDIRSNPETWERVKGGLKKGSVYVYDFGNGHKWFGGWFTSIVSVSIDGIETKCLSWRDKYRLEEAFKWWMRNSTVEMHLSEIMNKG